MLAYKAPVCQKTSEAPYGVINDNNVALAASHSCSGAVRHRHRPAFSLGRSPCPHTRTRAPAAICGCSLQYNGLHTHNSCNTWITTHLPTKEG